MEVYITSHAYFQLCYFASINISYFKTLFSTPFGNNAIGKYITPMYFLYQNLFLKYHGGNHLLPVFKPSYFYKCFENPILLPLLQRLLVGTILPLYFILSVYFLKVSRIELNYFPNHIFMILLDHQATKTLGKLVSKHNRLSDFVVLL